MTVSIRSNSYSLMAQRRLDERSADAQSISLRLASGQRINSASDDAAGLSVAAGLNFQTRVYTQAIRNVGDGISFLRIAEGALDQLSHIATRQVELAEQAANGTLSLKQRVALDQESDALTREYSRILSTTEFNGISIFGGAGSTVSIQAGFGDGLALEIGRGMGTLVANGTVEGTGSWSAPLLGEALLIDINGDGNLDLVGSDTSSRLRIKFGDGAGGESSSLTQELGPLFTSIRDNAAADLDGDGDIDLVVWDYDTNNVGVLYNNGNGTFAVGQTFLVNTNYYPGTSSVSLGDVNGDGRLDLVTIGTDAPGMPGNTVVRVFNGNGDGTFQSYSYQFTTGSEGGNGALGDINGDGILDIGIAYGHPFSGGQLLIGNGDGTFAVRATEPGIANLQFSMMADIDNDGKDEFIASGPNGITVMKYDDSKNSKLSVYFTDTTIIGGAGKAFAVGDYNGDGINDLIRGTDTLLTLAIYLGQDKKAPVLGYLFDGPDAARSVNFGDVNNDGRTDIVVTTNASTSLLSGGTRSLASPFLDLRSAANARLALATGKDLLQRLASERNLIGAFASRLNVAFNTLQISKETTAHAQSRITDADIAYESAQYVRSQIGQKVAASILAQANQQPALAIRLLK